MIITWTFIKITSLIFILNSPHFCVFANLFTLTLPLLALCSPHLLSASLWVPWPKYCYWLIILGDSGQPGDCGLFNSMPRLHWPSLKSDTLLQPQWFAHNIYKHYQTSSEGQDHPCLWATVLEEAREKERESVCVWCASTWGCAFTEDKPPEQRAPPLRDKIKQMFLCRRLECVQYNFHKYEYLSASHLRAWCKEAICGGLYGERS